MRRKRRSRKASPYWFAWYPVFAKDAHGEKWLVWLERVRCRELGHPGYYEYSLVEEDDDVEAE